MALIVVGVLLLGFTVATLAGHRTADPAPSGPAPAAAAGADPLSDSIAQYQERLRTNPDDGKTWASLGFAYVERARITADPSYYDKAQGALQRSMAVKPDDNAEAMIAFGALANSRHDFATGRDWGEKARAIRPSTAAVFGVLADSYTQLGDADAATAAVQRMLDLQPGVASFTRASYELELHGQVDDARTALQRGLDSAFGPSDIAFCRYYLGELAFNSGQLDEAERQYEAGQVADPGYLPLQQGRAKVAAARGQLDAALTAYADLTQRLPLPQYIGEYAELLRVAGWDAELRTQLALLATQQRLYADQGANDDLTAALIQADLGDSAQALRHAQAEWGRRHMMLVADALAWALHVNGRDAEALGYVEAAAAPGYRNALFAYHRGVILRGLGRRAEAEQQLDAALQINPYFSPLQAPLARQALAELRAGR